MLINTTYINWSEKSPLPKKDTLDNMSWADISLVDNSGGAYYLKASNPNYISFGFCV